MKAFISTASALILSATMATTALAHPESYGPDGLIPHSHTSNGTVMSGSMASTSQTDCPAVAIPSAPEVRPTGLCIRVNHGRPQQAHGSVNRVVYTAQPVIQPVMQPVMQPIMQPAVRPIERTIIHRPIIQRPIIQQPAVHHHVVQPIVRPIAQPVRLVHAAPTVQPVRLIQPQVAVYAPLVRAPVALKPVGPQLVTQFHYKGEIMDVVNTNLRGLLGMSLIKIINDHGATQASWWTSKGHCFNGPAYQQQACWSREGYKTRFTRELERSILSVSGPGKQRSNDPCDHYSKLEATISGDTSGFCGY